MQNPHYDYAVIGGDLRQVYLTEELARQYRVCHYALAASPKEPSYSEGICMTAVSSLEKACLYARCVIGPIPLSKNGYVLNGITLDEGLPLESLLAHLQPGQCFFGGCIPQSFVQYAQERGVFVFDLMLDPELVFYNTISTAEGALCEAISRSPLNLHGSRCAVLGYGKCGRTLVQYLKGICGHLLVSTDDEEERAMAALLADETGNLNRFRYRSGEFDFIFNTVPALVVDAVTLKDMSPGVTIIDIASAPGGVDYAEAKQLGVSAHLCPGLPGKYAPSSSAKAVKSAIEAFQCKIPFQDVKSIMKRSDS